MIIRGASGCLMCSDIKRNRYEKKTYQEDGTQTQEAQIQQES